jgi:hypothetical protein
VTDLLPFDAYSSDLRFDRRRIGVVVGLLFGIVFASLMLAMVWQSGWTEWRLLATLAVALVAGLAFGFLLPGKLEARVLKALRSVYDGRGRYATVPPAEGFTHRLPSSLVRSPRISVGGVLYIGPSRMAFVPHALNLPAHRAVLDIPTESLEVAVRTARPTAVQRFLAPGQREWLSLATQDQSWDFAVPTPSAVARAIASVLAGHS